MEGLPRPRLRRGTNVQRLVAMLAGQGRTTARTRCRTRGTQLERGQTAGTPAAKALKGATRTIPIVMAVIGDPVARELLTVCASGRKCDWFDDLATDLVASDCSYERNHSGIFLWQ